MVEIVSSNTTIFMLWVFIFMEVWESYRMSGQAWGRRWSTGQGLVLCYIIFAFLKIMDVWPHEWQSSALVRPMSWVRTWALLLWFSHFSPFHFAIFAGLGSVFWAMIFLLTLLPVLLHHPLSFFYLYYLFYFHF